MVDVTVRIDKDKADRLDEIVSASTHAPGSAADKGAFGSLLFWLSPTELFGEPPKFIDGFNVLILWASLPYPIR